MIILRLIKEDYMKTLLITFSILMMTVACSKEDPQATFQQEKEEARIDFREEVNEAERDRSEVVEDARDDLQEEQKEEAIDYVDESESVDLNKNEQRIKVNEKTEK